MFYICVSSRVLDTAGCSGPLTQTSWRGLSVIYTGSKQCAVPETRSPFADIPGIDLYIALANCNEAENKRFNFIKFF